MNVVWTSGAKQDLREIHQYVAQDSESEAQRLVDRLVKASERLESFPFSGRVVPEYAENRVREIVAPPYRLIYALLADRVDVLAVVHSARDISGEPG